ncbi:MAG: DUF4214 domain-containing protein [Actinomycetota bacterium]
MNSDPSTAQMFAAVSAPLPTDDRSMTRRRFLQAAAFAGGAAMVPAWLAEAADAAVPLRGDQGVLVLLTMGGGNDGLNTVIPVLDGTYHDQRRSLAIGGDRAIPLTNDRGLHPNLSTLNALWHTGDVAIVEGVGATTNANLSHFSSMARWMAGNADHIGSHSGWLGRYLDGLPGGDDPYHGVNIGHSIPLLMQGQTRMASGLPADADQAVKFSTGDSTFQRTYAAMAAFGDKSLGRGELTDAIGTIGRRAVDLATDIAPFYAEDFPEDELSAKLDLAARLINANLGIRVISVSYGDFDSHSGQAAMHDARMREFNDALATFYRRLDPSFAARTLLLTASEFGRRLRTNGSNGTDHGTASTIMAIGQQVKGGFYGEMPSFTNLDRQRNLRPTVDYRSVYATVLDSWLGADSGQVLNGEHENLRFLAQPAVARTTTGRVPEVANPTHQHRAQIVRLYKAYFGRLPDTAGLDHWVAARRSGLSLAAVSEAMATSAEFVAQYGALSDAAFVDRIYHNVLGRSPDAAGLDHWVSTLGRGVPRGSVMLGFSESDEFVTATASAVEDVDARGPVARLYKAYFRRDGDRDGLRYWIGTDLSYEAIADAFADSGEFRQTYGSLSDPEFVDLVYQNVLGRPPDPAGRRYWIEQLALGTSRGAAMLGFSESNEFVTKTGTLP